MPAQFHSLEVVACSCSSKKLFRQISQHLMENICIRAPFLMYEFCSVYLGFYRTILKDCLHLAEEMLATIYLIIDHMAEQASAFSLMSIT